MLNWFVGALTEESVLNVFYRISYIYKSKNFPFW